MSRISGAGLSVEIPQGWEGRIYTKPSDSDVAAEGFASAESATPTNAVLHLASFAMPPGAGDYGGGATERMTNRDLLVTVIEHGRESASAPLFAASGIPRVTKDDVSTMRLQRLIDGQGGVQKFFNVNGRAFCLYIVFGSYARRVRTIPVVNEILKTLTID